MNERELVAQESRVHATGGYIDLAEAVRTAAYLNNTYSMSLCVTSNAHYQPDESKRRYLLAWTHGLTSDTPQSSIVWR
jgi:hypothetical protein